MSIIQIFKGVLKRSAQTEEWPALSTRTCLPSILEVRCFDDGYDEYDRVDDVFDDRDGDDDGEDVFDDIGDDHDNVCQVSWMSFGSHLIWWSCW